jgi:phosphoserine phosphatase
MLIIFDVEGVLLNAEYLPVLAQVMGPRKEKEIWDITNAASEARSTGKRGSDAECKH